MVWMIYTRSVKFAMLHYNYKNTNYQISKESSKERDIIQNIIHIVVYREQVNLLTIQLLSKNI